MEDIIFEYGECSFHQRIGIKLPANKYYNLVRKYVNIKYSLAGQMLTSEWGSLSEDSKYRVCYVDISAPSASELVVKINEYKQEVLSKLKKIEDEHFDLEMEDIVETYGIQKLQDCFTVDK